MRAELVIRTEDWHVAFPRKRFYKLLDRLGMKGIPRDQLPPVGKVMREYKAGTLHSGKGGPVVKSKKQAVAIALAKAGKVYAAASEGVNHGSYRRLPGRGRGGSGDSRRRARRRRLR